MLNFLMKILIIKTEYCLQMMKINQSHMVIGMLIVKV